MTLNHNHRPWDETRALEIIQELKSLPGALMPILHALHEEFGYADPSIFTELGDALNLSRAEVVGVVSFYKDFRQTPPGQHHLQVCRAESCQAMGSDRLVDHIEQSLGVKLGETTPDNVITADHVFCLGNCALSPAVMLDGRLYGRVSEEKADQIIAQARGQA